MKHIYAPHRSAYFDLPKEDGCLFCNIISSDTEQDKDSLILYRGSRSFAMLNKYPYNNGHTMIVPYRHISFINELEEPELLEIYKFLKIVENILLTDYKAEGINTGINIREAAGAGIINHIHYHILPRWSGDSNFMTAISGTRVIPESFENTYNRIKNGFMGI